MDKRQTQEFEAFVAEFGPGLMRLAVLLTSDRAAGEDLFQETLQRMAARWGKASSPVAFSRRIMVNLGIDRHRAGARRPRETPWPAAMDPSDPRSGDDFTSVEMRSSVLRALDSLTDLQRAVVVLRYLDDRSDSDIAELLHISAGAVRSTAFRAVAHLKRHPDLSALFITDHNR